MSESAEQGHCKKPESDAVPCQDLDNTAPRIKGSLAAFFHIESSALYTLFKSQLDKRLRTAILAIKEPPSWSSIEELEADWCINDQNRKRYLNGQRCYVTLLSSLLGLIVLGLFNAAPASPWLLLSRFVIVLISCTVLLLMLSISLWRIDVLVSRQPQSYPVWLGTARVFDEDGQMNRTQHVQPERSVAALCFCLIALCGATYYLIYPWLIGQLVQLVRFEISLLNTLSNYFLLGGGFEVERTISAMLEDPAYQTASSEGRLFELKRFTHQFLVWGALATNGLLLIIIFIRAKTPFVGPMTLRNLDVFISRFYYPSRPVVGRGYQNRDPIRDPSARFALKPWEFALEHRLLLYKGKPLIAEYHQDSFSPKKPDVAHAAEICFDRELASEVFKHQLGLAITPKMKSSTTKLKVLDLPSEYRAVLLALICDLDVDCAREYGTSQEWLKQYATSFWDLKKLLNQRPPTELPALVTNNLNILGVDKALDSAVANRNMANLLGRSAYLNTLMAQLMTRSRLSSANMIWLKPINRTLFYVLNNAGRPRRLFVEGHAPHAHAQIERAVEQSLVVPQLEGSVDALEQELLRHGWIMRDSDGSDISTIRRNSFDHHQTMESRS